MRNLNLFDLAFLSTANSNPLPPGAPIFWFDGDRINDSVLNHGDPVDTWLNRGSNALVSITQSTPAKKPTYFISAAGHKGLAFVRTSQQSLGATLATTQTQPHLMVVIARAETIPGVAISSNDASVNQFLGTSLINGNIWFGGGTAQINGANSSVNTSNIQVITLLSNSTSSILKVDHLGPGTNNAGTHGFKGPRIGNLGTTETNGFNGEIYQALVYAGSSITHEQILAWAELKFRGTAPFSP